jgi:hypothetical protein
MYLEGKLFFTKTLFFSPEVMPQKQNPYELRATRAANLFFVF